MISFTVPVKTENPLNGPQGRTRGAIMAKAAKRKKHRETAKLLTLSAGACHRIGVAVNARRAPAITMTRLSAGKLDGDGLQAALKSVRDGIADALGVNDGSDAVVWKYEQRKCKRGEFGVVVEIT